MAFIDRKSDAAVTGRKIHITNRSVATPRLSNPEVCVRDTEHVFPILEHFNLHLGNAAVCYPQIARSTKRQVDNKVGILYPWSAVDDTNHDRFMRCNVGHFDLRAKWKRAVGSNQVISIERFATGRFAFDV